MRQALFLVYAVSGSHRDQPLSKFTWGAISKRISQTLKSIYRNIVITLLCHGDCQNASGFLPLPSLKLFFLSASIISVSVHMPLWKLRFTIGLEGHGDLHFHIIVWGWKISLSSFSNIYLRVCFGTWALFFNQYRDQTILRVRIFTTLHGYSHSYF